MAFARGLAGAGTGAATGAAIGSVIPGIGTAIGAGVGGGLGLLTSLLSGDPYGKASDEYKKYIARATGYEQPYYQGGLDQYGRLNTATGQLLNPAELENQWIQSYETSPYAKQALAQNQTAGLDAASSMGLMGSSAALQNIQQGAGQIQQQDREKYLNDLMQKYMTGIGLGQNLYGIGAQTGGNIANQIATEGGNLAGLKYASAAQPMEMLSQAGGMGFSILNSGNKFNTGK